MRTGLERIRRFSVAVWVLGTVVVAVIALVVLPQIAVNPQTGDVYVGTDPEDDYWPWLEEDPQEYEIVDGVLEGTAEGGYLRLDADSEMLMLSNTEGVGEADWVRLYQQQGTAGNIPLAAAFTVVPIVIMGIYLVVARRMGAFDAL